MAASLPTASIPTPEPSISLPIRPPDPQAGQAIYSENCSACHGLNGLGDGELVANLDFPPSPLGELQFARQAIPLKWYEMVTVGNLERLMPGFASLNDSQRWDAVAYTLLLSTSPDEIASGEASYAETCLECHAADGGDLEILTQSGEQLYAWVSDDEIHPIAADLSESDVWELVGYMRSLPFRQPELAAEEVSASTTGIISGQVRNGTPGSFVPEGLEIVLTGVEAEAEVISEVIQIAEDGSYTIEDLEIVAGRLFFVTANYQGVTYRSEIAHFLVEEPFLELPITIYESMSSQEPIRVDRLHVLFDFPDADTIRVLQLWVLSNLSDRVLKFDGSNPVLEVELPREALNLTFEEGRLGDRFTLTESGFGDLAPMMPGIGVMQLVFSFDLPYERGLEIQSRLNYPVDAVILLMPDGGPRLGGEGIEDLGLRDMGGISMVNYSASSIPAGGSLAIRLSGRHLLDQSNSAPNELIFGAGVLLLVGAATAYVWISGQRKRGEVPERLAPLPDLINAIARLDIDHEQGRIDTTDYERRREQLKARAAERVERDRSS
jgi:mono/diheme cytochrome c family protein